jgi:hypothetical protein
MTIEEEGAGCDVWKATMLDMHSLAPARFHQQGF